MDEYKINPRVQNLTNTKKRKFYLSSRNPDWAFNPSSYWSGGSITYYTVLNISNGQRRPLVQGVYPTYKAKDSLGENEILIETGVSSGKESTPHINYRSNEKENVFKFLNIHDA